MRWRGLLRLEQRVTIHPMSTAPRPDKPRCPQCRLAGSTVARETVQALVSVSLRQVSDTAYYFCATTSCPVVYYSAEGGITFGVSDVREAVYQKMSNRDDVFVCYCFRYTVSAIRNAPPESREAAIQDIRAGIQANQCACHLRNPQGTCCLPNVRRLAAQASQ